MSYQYKRPKGTKYKVSIAKWNKMFAKRGRWPFVIAEVYVDQENGKATVQYVISLVGKIFFIVFLPFFVIIGTVIQGLPETLKDIKGGIFQKRLGKFGADEVYKERGNGWEKLKNLIPSIK